VLNDNGEHGFYRVPSTAILQGAVSEFCVGVYAVGVHLPPTGSASIAGLDINKAKDFAKRFGIAFQIRDDLLNIIENNPDKPTNNDIEDGIYTAPVIFAKGTENLDYGIEKTKELLDNYFNRAKKCIEKAPNNEYKSAIIELIEILKI